MKRGEVWTVQDPLGDYAGKLRPAVIIQKDDIDGVNSITLCMITTNETDVSDFRIPVEPTAENGLNTRSLLMVDKIVTLPSGRIGMHIGRLSDADMTRLDQAILVFLGLA